VVGVAVDHVEQLVAEHGELGRRRTARLGDAVGAPQHLVHHPVVDRREQPLLGADVVVERALAEVVGITELVEARGVVPLPGEQARRRVDDRLAARLPLRVASRDVGRIRSRHGGTLPGGTWSEGYIG
jgi:hypothetical protein